MSEIVAVFVVILVLVFFNFAAFALIKLNEREARAIKDKINEIGEKEDF